MQMEKSLREKVREHHQRYGKNIQKVIQGILIFLMIGMTLCMMREVSKIQGDARVVNYAGILRGATQRMVKLEIAGKGDNDLEKYLDDIFDGLLHGGGKYHLTSLNDEDYQRYLELQYNYWKLLKKKIDIIKRQGYGQTDLLSMSETYFHLADDTVSAAEIYSQKCATRISQLERALSVVMILIVCSMIQQSIEEVMLMKSNKDLKKKAYIDLHTGLPNKSRCEELLMDRENVSEEDAKAVMIFDLNGLKRVNDTLGHLAGDTLIANFANALRTSIPEYYFVGRYGGDEFIAILEHTDKEKAEAVIANIQTTVDHYNEFSRQAHMEFAWGYAISTEFPEATLKVLLEQADRRMYERKKTMKGARV